MNSDMQEIKVVCFRLGKEVYALDIMRVREIIKPLPISGLPMAPSFIEGVINLRGAVIPVVELRRKFELPERTATADCRLLITVIDRQPLALVVDAVTEVVSIPLRDLRPKPTVVRVAGYHYLIGVCLLRDFMVLLVNLDSILDDGESEALHDFRASDIA